MERYVLTVLTILLITQQGVTQSTDTFTDPRDGQKYKTINIKNDSTGTTITWMAQNLNYKTPGT